MTVHIFKYVSMLAIVLLTIALAGCGATDQGGAENKGVNDSASQSSAPAAKTTAVIPPEKRDPTRLWCNEHGLYEDECVICHPEIANKKPAAADKDASEAPRDPNRLWCNEHGVYEDECYICHPELKDKKSTDTSAAEKHDDHTGHEHAPGEKHEEGDGHDHGNADTGAKSDQSAKNEASAAPASGLFCKEHNLPEAECGNCRPEVVANLPVGKGIKVRFVSDESTNKAGVMTGTPVSRGGASASQFLGQVTFNRNQLADITPLAEGVLLDVLKDVGQTVEVGEILTNVHSSEIASVRREIQQAQAEARLAGQTLAREQDLYKRKISPRQDLENAQAAVSVHQSAIEAGRQHLLTLGLTKDEVAAVLSAKTNTPTLPVRAPFSGTIVERNATRGKAVHAEDALFQIADLSTMWMEFSIGENQIAAVPLGTRISARFEAYPGVSFDGEVEWVGASIDPQTRKIKARALLANPQGMLKDGLFGRVTLSGAIASAGVSVPEAAIQDVDGRPVVFRKLEEDLYETLPVELGAASDGQVIVLAGLAAEDRIVTQGSYVVKSELLKGRLGAGCTDH